MSSKAKPPALDATPMACRNLPSSAPPRPSPAGNYVYLTAGTYPLILCLRFGSSLGPKNLLWRRRPKMASPHYFFLTKTSQTSAGLASGGFGKDLREITIRSAMSVFTVWKYFGCARNFTVAVAHTQPLRSWVRIFAPAKNALFLALH